MRRLIKPLILLLLLTITLSIGAVAVSAEEESLAKEIHERFLPMGYEFYEHDPTVPKYKVIYPDGTEVIRYDSNTLHLECSGRGYEGDEDYIRKMPSGSTIQLMSDIYYLYGYELDLELTMIGVSDGRTINFDFAGHTFMRETKNTTMFVATGKNSTINAYSTKPGANLILLMKNSTTKAGNVVSAKDNATVNIGSFCGTTGRNLSTYTGCACNVYSGATINFQDVDLYRMANDHTGFFCVRSSRGKLNLDRVHAYGVVRDLQIHTGSDYKARNVVINVRDSIMANIGVAGSTYGAFYRYLCDGNVINFENTAFANVQMTIEAYKTVYTGDESADTVPQMAINFDEKCSYSTLPNYDGLANKQIFHFPTLATNQKDAPENIFVNGAAVDAHYFNIKNPSPTEDGNSNYIMENHPNAITAPYIFIYEGYEDDVAQVIWDMDGNTTEQYWLIGETPYPHELVIPSATEYVSYEIEDPYPVTPDGAIYTITPIVNIDFKYSITFAKDFIVNFYIPVLNDLKIEDLIEDVLVGTNTIDNDIIKESEIVVIDGKEHYKVISAIPYNKVTDTLRFSADFYGTSKRKAQFSVSGKVALPDVLESYLDGDYTDAFKERVKGSLYAIRDSRKTQSSALKGIYALIEKKFGEK